jgi:outer membrane protein OmpA-like peptidoglycan-associated protein
MPIRTSPLLASTRLRHSLCRGLLALSIAGCATSPVPSSPELQLKLDTHTLSVGHPPAAVQATAQEAASDPRREEDTIYFSSGSARIDQDGEQKLRLHASRMAAHRRTVVTLTGLTDDQGSRSFNLLIAEQRIEAVAKILRSNGVLKSQLRSYARGNGASASSCRTPACREKARRVELSYADH